jgi:Ni/Co efflux regulator RcnB
MKMKKEAAASAILAAMMLCIAPIASAQDRHDDDRQTQDQHDSQKGHDNGHGQQGGHDQPHAFVQHDDWKQGAHMNTGDWNRGQKLDWHAHHFNKPPRGYEWREVDGNYVLAAITTGVIVSVIVATH